MPHPVLSPPRPSPRLSGLPGYGRGRVGAAGWVRHALGSNECPEPPSPAVQAAAAAAMAGAQRYPDLRGETLAAALAARHGVAPEAVAVAAGSVVLLDLLLRAHVDPGDEVVCPWRSYEAYPILIGLAGARMVPVGLDAGHGLDPQAIRAAVGPRCRAVILCNPNNPTGTALPPARLDALLAALPPDVLVILDEAYAEFAPPALMRPPAERLARHPNLAVLRTFSKAYGLAGLRAGYALAAPEIVDAVLAAAPPFPLPGPALAAARAALDEPEALAARVARNAHQRDRLAQGLAAAGLPVAASAANFLWLPLGGAAEALAAHLRAAGIATRLFPGEGVRITTGTADDTGAVLAALQGWRAPA